MLDHTDFFVFYPVFNICLQRYLLIMCHHDDAFIEFMRKKNKNIYNHVRGFAI